MSTRARLASLPVLQSAGALMALLCLLAAGPAGADEAKIPIKVVVVTMFEVGEDSGDTPGEFQEWVENSAQRNPAVSARAAEAPLQF
jgi:purine nucleoside permease